MMAESLTGPAPQEGLPGLCGAGSDGVAEVILWLLQARVELWMRARWHFEASLSLVSFRCEGAMTERDVEGTDPKVLFSTWMGEAEQSETNDPNAVALATCGKDGMPSVRMVLMKKVTDQGFCFFTNEGSEKGQQLAENMQAAMCFHWKSLRRQVRLEGSVSLLSDAEVDEYFHSRSRRSQIGAAVSEQSRVLPTRQELERKVEAFGREHPDEIPRPAFWRGYALQPRTMEFWQDGPDRLHDRFLFTRDGNTWPVVRLYP